MTAQGKKERDQQAGETAPIHPTPESGPKGRGEAIPLAEPSGEVLRAMLTTMVRIRSFEERVEKLFLAGKLPGFVHLYLGEEAIAAAVCACLSPQDYITSTHRGHGHVIAKSGSLNRVMAELFGKRTGLCKGKGGSMHVADFGVGMLGANGIVGGGFGIATGAALSARYQGSGQVAVCFFGDGGANKGTFHEALNFAAVKRLPVIFVCENNAFAQYTAVGVTHAVPNVADRGVAYNMPGRIVDGNDALAVYAATMEAVACARKGEGPSLLEMKTYRWRGHFVGDVEAYRNKAEVAEWQKRDPIGKLERYMLERGLASAEEIEAVWTSARQEVEEAVRFAEESPYPGEAEAFEDLWADSTTPTSGSGGGKGL